MYWAGAVDLCRSPSVVTRPINYFSFILLCVMCPCIRNANEWWKCITVITDEDQMDRQTRKLHANSSVSPEWQWIEPRNSIGEIGFSIEMEMRRSKSRRRNHEKARPAVMKFKHIQKRTVIKGPNPNRRYWWCDDDAPWATAALLFASSSFLSTSLVIHLNN